MQLRGEKLQAFLKKCLLEDISSKTLQNGKYHYSQKAFAERTGVSRQTIRAHQGFIDQLLATHNFARRVLDKNAKVASLEKMVEKMSRELDSVTRRFESMRAQYLMIFKVLVEESFVMSKLASVTEAHLEYRSDFDHGCPLCCR